MKKPFISRIVIKNYKSIARCDVKLGALQFLVGRNGSGKSNFLDALEFVRDVLVWNRLEVASKAPFRGEIMRRGAENGNLGMRLEFNLPDNLSGLFAFELKQVAGEEYTVAREVCVINKNGAKIKRYEIRDGKVLGENAEKYPPASSDRLYLLNMTGGMEHEYRLLCGYLSTLFIYNITPAVMKLPQESVSDIWLAKHGGNVAQALSMLADDSKERIREYLNHIVPFVYDFKEQKIEGFWFLSFFHRNVQEEKPWKFSGNNMSEGTLRALGVLTALFQKWKDVGNKYAVMTGAPIPPPALVCIEEPEAALHSRAAGALLGALMEASEMRQVIVATHSTDMLDDKEITPDQILPVEMKGAETVIAPLEDISVGMLKDHLTTAGELLRQDQLNPAETDAGEPDLFDE